MDGDKLNQLAMTLLGTDRTLSKGLRMVGEVASLVAPSSVRADLAELGYLQCETCETWKHTEDLEATTGKGLQCNDCRSGI